MGREERLARALEHHGAGRLAEAEALYRQVLAEDPQSIDALHFIGVIALQRGDAAQAVALISQAIERNEANAPAHSNLGLAFAALGKATEAARAWLTALALQPSHADALGNLRLALEPRAAERISDPVIVRDALWLIGEAHSRANQLDEAAACMERILARDAADAAAHTLLGNVRRNQARHGEAMAHYEAAIRANSDPVAYQNLLFAMMCSPDCSPAEIHARHLEFARRYEAPLLATAPSAFGNARNPERRLRIGYVSPDLRNNVVGHFMQPILARHDRSQFEVHVFFIGKAPDAFTASLAPLVERWHDAGTLGEEELAALVRREAIDILVDLSGHGPGNRILAFARRPAPVQASYLDYSATTGFASIDYRLTTAYCDPPGAERYYTEKLLRLPGAYWTYNPTVQLPVAPLPMQANGYPTFGSFNLYYRITDKVLDLWARLLAAIPRSRLVVVSIAPGSTQAALLARLARAGVAAERVSLHGVVSYPDYHALIGSVDIALGPFPYNGATTALDCLWNGVPVVSKAGGETFHSRLGCAVLDCVALDELIAADDDAYIRIAADLAADAGRLASMRSGLRARLERSPLRDFSGFTRALESAYRLMWRDWCARPAK